MSHRAVFVVTREGTIAFLNDRAEHLYGVTSRDVIAQPVASVLGGMSQAMWAALDAASGGVSVEHLTQCHQTASGPAAVRVSVYPLLGPSGHAGPSLLVVDPIHSTAGRPSTDDAMGARSDDACLGDMVSVIAHEVRNPLAGVRAAVEMFERQLPAAARHSPVVAEVLGRIDALDTLVDDLLDFSETPRPSFSDVAVEPLLTELAARLEQRHEVTVRVTVTGPVPNVHADARLLRTIFLNLMTNAAQATPPGGAIEVDIASQHPMVAVSIADQGPGFSADARAAMFRPFFTTKSRGTGLGLPTARRLVEVHGGTLTLDDHRAIGARLIVSLPEAQRTAHFSGDREIVRSVPRTSVHPSAV